MMESEILLSLPKMPLCSEKQFSTLLIYDGMSALYQPTV